MVYEVQNILYNITNSQRKKYIKKVSEYRYHDMYTLLAGKDVKQNDR